jgi:hypothetical protein
MAMFGGSLDELFGNGIASILLAADDAFLNLLANVRVSKAVSY